MKKYWFFIVIAAISLFAFSVAGHAQEASNPIKVTTKINDDGSRTETIKNLDTHTSEVKVYDAKQKVTQRAVYTLNDQGQEVEGTIYNGKDVAIGQVSFKYDVFGRVQEQTEKAPNGAVLRRMVFIHDQNGRVINVETYDAQGNQIKGDGSIATPTPRKSRR